MAAVLFFAAVESSHAAPLGFFHHTAADQQAKAKMISFNVRNDSKETLVLKVGEQQYTIEPGKTTAFKLAEGPDMMAVSATPHLAAGAVITKVGKQLSGNTLVIS